MKHIVRALLGGLGLALCITTPARAEPEKLYFFGNSLMHHLTDSTNTTVPHWLGHFADNAGRSIRLDGQWGFEREFDDKLPPEPEWEFKSVKSAWGNARNFNSVGYDSIVFNLTNFIQYRGPGTVYEWDNPKRETPVSVSLNLLEKTANGKKVFVYGGWGDMEPYGYPPSKRKLRQFHKYNTGEFHDWHLEFVQLLKKARPDLDIEFIPTARVLSRAFLETGLGKINTVALYTDDMTHGSATLYYLAAAVTYASLYDELPKFGSLPRGIDPLVEPYFNAFLKIIAEETGVTRRAALAPTKTPTTPAAAAQIEQVVTVSGPGAPSLGMGLNAIADWSTQMPFVNHMKSARPWIGHRLGRWGGWEFADIEADGMLDANGWPKYLPPEIDGLETMILTELPKDLTSAAGKYRLTYEGEGRVDLTGLARPISYGKGEIWFRFQPGDGSVGVKISETDPKGTGNYVRNIAVVREDQIPFYEMGVTFNPDWLKVVQDLRLVRFMDWMQTNETAISSWDQRPIPGDFTYMRRGVPVEVMLELSNLIGADPWFNMPHQADETYVRGFATAVRDGLRPGLKAHVEYSNEVWNFIFPQTEWAQVEARARWGRKAAEDAWFQLAGIKAAETMQIWTEVFQTQPDRIVRVAAVHTGWPGLEEAFLEARLDPLRPADWFDAYAVTGYFGHELGDADGPANIKRWLRKGMDHAIAKATDEIRGNSLRFLTREAWPHHAEAAARYGLDLIMYEGGTHVVGHGDWVNDIKLTEFFAELNYSDEMGALYLEAIEAWTQAGGKLFNAFVDVAGPSKWGSWGALRSLEDQNARYQALLTYNASGLGHPDGRGMAFFANGTIQHAHKAGGSLVGTGYGDILMGGAGDDVITSNGGDDRIFGGDGVDHVELAGFMEEYRFFTSGKGLRAESQYGSVTIQGAETLSFTKMPGVILGFENFF